VSVLLVYIVRFKFPASFTMLTKGFEERDMNFRYKFFFTVWCSREFYFWSKIFSFRTFDYRSDNVAEGYITQEGTRKPSFNKELNVKIFRGKAFCAAPRLSLVATKIVQAAIKLLTERISLLLILEFFYKNFGEDY